MGGRESYITPRTGSDAHLHDGGYDHAEKKRQGFSIRNYECGIYKQHQVRGLVKAPASLKRPGTSVELAHWAGYALASKPA